MRLTTSLLGLALMAPCLGAQTMKNPKASCAPLAVLDSVALIRDIYRLADDSMLGRDRGSPEAIKARHYLADRFKAAGLIPFKGSYIQPVSQSGGEAGQRGGQEAAPSAALDLANVVGWIKGRTNPDQYIVVTAHYDHVGVRLPRNRDTISRTPIDSIFNGADDNASGASALAVMAEYFVKAKPAHSIIFAAVDAEERGMVGSRGFVSNPPVQLNQMLLNVNLDMVSRNDKNELYASGTYHNPALKPLVEASIACSPINLRIGHDDPANRRDDWTNQSDQGSFHAKGIPFIYFGVEDHPDYHQPGDSPDHIMKGFYVGAIRTVTDFISRFDQKPVQRKQE